MLVWLDSNSNVKGQPNENYARELMELFSLGVGHYTEKDIREAARAFTGWRTDGSGFAFDARLHDGGTKTVLGQTGTWDGGDVVRIVLEQPAAARFLVRKLYRYLVSEKADAARRAARAALRVVPPERLRHRRAGPDDPGLAALLLGPRLPAADQGAGGVRAGGGAVRCIGATARRNRTTGRCRSRCWSARIEAMGQSLFAPPNVKGWPGGTAWLNTSTVLERDNFAEALAMGTLWPGRRPRADGRDAVTLPHPGAAGRQAHRVGTAGRCARGAGAAPGVRPGPAPGRGGVSRPEAIVGALLDRYLPGGVRPDARAKLVAFVADGRPSGPALARRVREAVHAILTMAEYQLA